MATTMQRLKLGDTVEVAIPEYYRIIRHVGLISGWDSLGRPMIISNSKKHGGIVEETLGEFANGQAVTYQSYVGNLPPQEIIRRARRHDRKPWNLLTWNCEHFVRWAQGMPEASPQLATGVIVIAAIGVSIFFFKRAA